jgi:hypothetical protein
MISNAFKGSKSSSSSIVITFLFLFGSAIFLGEAAEVVVESRGAGTGEIGLEGIARRGVDALGGIVFILEGIGKLVILFNGTGVGFANGSVSNRSSESRIDEMVSFSSKSSI